MAGEEETKGAGGGRAAPWYARDYVWTFTTYFTEGFPFTLIRTVSAVYFRDMKVSLQAIGLTSLYGLPWVLKFLWSPQIDQFGTKRRWLVSLQCLLVCVMVLAAVFAPLDWGPQAIAAIFFFGAIVAATMDIAIDGYYMEALDKQGQAKYVGYRVMAYRIAMMTGTGVIVTIGAKASWWLAFAAAAGVFGLLFAYHLFFLAEVQPRSRPMRELLARVFRLKAFVYTALAAFAVVGIRIALASGWYEDLKKAHPIVKDVGFPHIVGGCLFLALALAAVFRTRIKAFLLKDPESHYGRTFISFADRERIGVVLAFVILLRAGEFMLGAMISPFLVDMGLKAHYGWISSVVGLPASIAGAIIGGRCIARFDLKRVIWPFVLAQNLTLLGYMAVAIHTSEALAANLGLQTPTPVPSGDIALVALAHFFEQFAGGLGTSVLMTFLMRICKPEFKAAHYAIGSGLMSMSGLYSGVASGFLAGWLGYAWTFGLSFVVSIPAMLLIPWLPNLAREK
jgi:PAT family beta-lactamase induction signal transducer AmpG